MKANPAYQNSFGWWSVTTEGDCEGKSTKNLGTYRGHIDEIAFHLADKCYYSLCFHRMKDEEMTDFVPKKTSVNVSLDIDSGTWELQGQNRINFFVNMLKDRPGIFVDEGTSYSSVTLKTNKISEKDLARQKALEKLTPDERKLLGIK